VVVPRVTTLNNREARFRVAEDTSYFEEVETDIMTSGGYNNSDSRDNVTYDYDRPTIVETGYSLIVTPSVGADLSAINMVLRPEISSIKE
jgi:type II secretory pathway component GspD/PulD (secretin)